MCACVCVCVVPLFAVMAGPPSPAHNTRLFLRDERIRPESCTPDRRDKSQTRQRCTIAPAEHQHTLVLLLILVLGLLLLLVVLVLVVLVLTVQAHITHSAPPST